MGRVTLTFHSQRDQEELTRCMKAFDMAGALWDISQYLRGIDRNSPDDEIDISKLRERINWIIHEDHNISFEDIYT